MFNRMFCGMIKVIWDTNKALKSCTTCHEEYDNLLLCAYQDVAV